MVEEEAVEEEKKWKYLVRLFLRSTVRKEGGGKHDLKMVVGNFLKGGNRKEEV